MGAMTTPPAAATRVLPRLAGAAAAAMAACLVWIWLPPVLAGVSVRKVPTDVAPTPAQTVALAVAAALLLHMLVATWFAHARAERRGLITAAAALVLYTGWLLFVDVFAGWRSHRWVKVIPEMIGLEPHSTVIANLGIASITVILLLVGAALLLTRPAPPEY